MTLPIAEDLKKSDFMILDHTLPNGELPHGYIQIHYNGTREEAYVEIVQPLLNLIQIKKNIENWKKRLESKAHIVEYTHDMIIDKIDNEILAGNFDYVRKANT